jgi:LacI family transcriptional regulator
MATRADVAARANVSPALVSYVLNGGPRPVSAQARARILAAIKELDYRPDPAASALSGGSSRTVGIIAPTTNNPYYSELVMEIEGQLFDAGRTALIGASNDDLDAERAYLDSFADRRADSVIVISSNPERLLASSTGRHPPLVVLGSTAEFEGTHVVDIDHAAEAMRVVEHLQSWGHTTITCITGPRHDPVAMARVEGWRRQQHRVGSPVDATLVLHSDISRDGGVRAARVALSASRLRSSGLRPTALFVTSDVQAIGALFACRELGLQVPGDISVAAIDGTQAARFSNPVLTTLRLPLRDVASALVAYACGETPTGATFGGNIVVGDSCAKPAQL